MIQYEQRPHADGVGSGNPGERRPGLLEKVVHDYLGMHALGAREADQPDSRNVRDALEAAFRLGAEIASLTHAEARHA